jgi:hypothetical protein
MSYTFDESIVSDLHKDARGFRPSCMWWKTWEESSAEEKQVIWDDICAELEEEINREKRMQENALANMKKRIADTIALGASDEVSALKWIIEAEGFDASDLMYGVSYFCYHFGLSYNVENTMPEIGMAIKEMSRKAA